MADACSDNGARNVRIVVVTEDENGDEAGLAAEFFDGIQSNYIQLMQRAKCTPPYHKLDPIRHAVSILCPLTSE
jgi:hypothetical protein